MADTKKTKTAAANQETTALRQVPKTAKEMLAMRKSRNFWVLGLIFGLAILFYLITILRMAGAS